MIFLLTCLCSAKPQRKKKPKSKTHKSNTLLVEKFHLEISTETAIQEYYEILSFGSINKKKTSSFIFSFS